MKAVRPVQAMLASGETPYVFYKSVYASLPRLRVGGRCYLPGGHLPGIAGRTTLGPASKSGGPRAANSRAPDERSCCGGGIS